ncbi:hypothetical protein VNI00_017077 [Paramarasmius palmivorus]|uniref:F-box domain-containing protein n=1 Tax=Paramarasmius palmivorus TaxID=297713 RepID=A0AAW0B751_9AGAR
MSRDIPSSPIRNTTELSRDHINTLPFELISYIFVLSRGVRESTVDLNPLNLGAFPLVLRNVCRKWRQVAEATPCLWRTIDIHVTASQVQAFMQHDQRVLQKSSTLLHRWLSLARQGQEHDLRSNAGMDITLSAHNTKSRTAPLYVAIITTLLPYSRFWRRLRLVIHSSYLRYLHTTPGHVPRLESLQLMIVRSASTPFRCVLDTFSDAPMLKRLSVRGFSRSMWDYVKLPWEQLDELHICEVENLDAVHAIGLAKSVTRVSVDARIDVLGEDLSDDYRLCHDSLKRLEYRGSSQWGFHRNYESMFRVLQLQR